MEPRKATSAGSDFPYTSPTICYIEIDLEGQVSQVTSHDTEVYTHITKGGSRLYAIWPGQYRSDLFIIDDPEEYARAMGILHDPIRTGLQEHEHQVWWQIDPSENHSRSAYVSVNVRLDCGCRIKDIRVFAAQMRRQKGWDVAVSSYPGSYQEGEQLPIYTLRARRTSLQ